MAESSLAVDVKQLRIKVAHLLGFGRDYDALSDSQKDWVKDCIHSGLRRFYWPEPDASGVSHSWSFMKPIKTLTMVAGQWQYDMPGEFASIEGAITSTSTSTNYPVIRLTGQQSIREMRQTQTGATGHPTAAALEWLEHEGVTGQRAQLSFFPTPDAAYEVEYQMVVLAEALTDVRRFPYGGAVHAETIVESCLAVAESRFNGTIGVHAAEFQKRLAVSISQDSQLCRAEIIGTNGNGTRIADLNRDRMRLTVTYNGQVW